MTRTTPLRRTILQFSQIRFTELLTFIIIKPPFAGRPFIAVSVSQDYTSPVKVIRRHLNGNGVARQNADKMHSHFARDVRRNFVPIFQFNIEHGIGQRLNDLSL
jgi:hypothetical protein